MLMRFVLLLIIFCDNCYAQPIDASKEDQASAVHEWADEVATKIEITVGPEESPATLSKQSLLRWSNSLNGDVYGDCYLWAVESRPVSFLSAYEVIGPQSNRNLTFQSLCPRPLVAKVNGKIVWSPESAGIEWTELNVEGNRPRNVEAAQRFLRTISNTFEGLISEVDDEQKLRQLRLLSQPIYKYETDGNSTAGALFAFADGTDPEILMLLEVGLQSESKVRYALVRQNHRRLVVKREMETIWELPQIAPPFPNPNVSDPFGIYFKSPWQEFVARTGIQVSAKK